MLETQVSVIFVNYKGRPWMKGLLENQPCHDRKPSS